jgi:hypothetical protein
MKITIEIDPLQFPAFLEKVKHIEGFLSLKLPNTEQISASENEIWTKIKNGLDEIKLIEQGKQIGKPLEQLLKELKDTAA